MSYRPRAHHSLRPFPVPVESLAPRQEADELLAAAGEANVGEAVLVGDDAVSHAAEAEDEGADEASPVLAGGAVDEERRGPRRVRQVGQDGREGREGVVGLSGTVEDARVSADESLFGSPVLER